MGNEISMSPSSLSSSLGKKESTTSDNSSSSNRESRNGDRGGEESGKNSGSSRSGNGRKGITVGKRGNTEAVFRIMDEMCVSMTHIASNAIYGDEEDDDFDDETTVDTRDARERDGGRRRKNDYRRGGSGSGRRRRGGSSRYNDDESTCDDATLDDTVTQGEESTVLTDYTEATNTTTGDDEGGVTNIGGKRGAGDEKKHKHKQKQQQQLPKKPPPSSSQSPSPAPAGSPHIGNVSSSGSLNGRPLASSFAKKCHFTKMGIGKHTQHYEGLTLQGQSVLMLAGAMKLKGCPTICDEDLRRVEKHYPNQFSRLPDELLLSSGWRRISKFCQFSLKPVPDGVPFFHTKERIHPTTGGFFFLLPQAVGMDTPSSLEPLSRDHLVVLETDFPQQSDAVPQEIIRNPSLWSLVDKFCFFSGGPINAMEDVYYETLFNGNEIYMLAFISPAMTAEQMFRMEDGAQLAVADDPIFTSTSAVLEVERVYDLTASDFEELRRYHLGPCRALPDSVLRPECWRKVYPVRFLEVRQKALERAAAYERMRGLEPAIPPPLSVSGPAAARSPITDGVLATAFQTPEGGGIADGHAVASVFAPNGVSLAPLHSNTEADGHSFPATPHQHHPHPHMALHQPHHIQPHPEEQQQQLPLSYDPYGGVGAVGHFPIQPPAYNPHSHRGYRPDMALGANGAEQGEYANAGHSPYMPDGLERDVLSMPREAPSEAQPILCHQRQQKAPTQSHIQVQLKQQTHQETGPESATEPDQQIHNHPKSPHGDRGIGVSHRGENPVGTPSAPSRYPPQNIDPQDKSYPEAASPIPTNELSKSGPPGSPVKAENSVAVVSSHSTVDSRDRGLKDGENVGDFDAVVTPSPPRVATKVSNELPVANKLDYGPVRRRGKQYPPQSQPQPQAIRNEATDKSSAASSPDRDPGIHPSEEIFSEEVIKVHNSPSISNSAKAIGGETHDGAHLDAGEEGNDNPILVPSQSQESTSGSVTEKSPSKQQQSPVKAGGTSSSLFRQRLQQHQQQSMKKKMLQNVTTPAYLKANEYTAAKRVSPTLTRSKNTKEQDQQQKGVMPSSWQSPSKGATATAASRGASEMSPAIVSPSSFDMEGAATRSIVSGCESSTSISSQQRRELILQLAKSRLESGSDA